MKCAQNLSTYLLLSSHVIMGVFFLKLDLMSDESDTEDQPDEWKKNRTLPPGARDQMRNFANKRGTHHFSCNTMYLIFKRVYEVLFLGKFH